MDDFKEVQQRTDILDYIQLLTGQQARRLGSCHTLPKCPFCESKSGFRIYPDKKRYKCFSTRCDRSGDSINFTAEYQKLTPLEALKFNAEKIGYHLQNQNGQAQKSEVQSKKEAIFAAAADLYHETLLKDKRALEILAGERKFTVDDVKTFRLGYTGNKPNLLRDTLMKTFDIKDLVESGLVKMRAGHPGDYFIKQLFVFPHLKGRQACDFTIRDAFKKQKDPDKVINYRLATEHRLRGVLFFNQDAQYHEEVFLVEGENDAIQLAKATGKKNVIAVCGTMSERQREWLREKLAGKTIFCCFDRDTAGDKYVTTVFGLLFDKARLRVLQWGKKDAPAKDIDEYLRLPGMEPEKHLKGLLDNQMEIFRYIITFLVPQVSDAAVQLEHLEPYIAKLADVNDDSLIDVCIEAIKDHFEEHKTLSRIVDKRIKKARQSQDVGKEAFESPVHEESGVYWYTMPNRSIRRLTNFKIIVQDRIFMRS